LVIRLKNDFSKLKRKILLRVLLIAVAAPIIGIIIQYILIDGILQSYFAEGFIQLCQNTFNISYAEGLNMYKQLFRYNKYLWLGFGLFSILLLIFYYALSQMTKYFNEVSLGVDKLVEESDDEIILSPEMDFMEAKLNKVKSILEKREKAAQEAEQQKNDLIVYLAHDIKTPLTSVIGYLSLLDEATDMPIEQRSKYVGITLDKAYRLEQLINEFFEITRFNLQKIILNNVNINITLMFQQIVDEFYPMLTPQGKQVVLKVQDGLTLWGDADKLARVFNNILKNAIAYSFENSIIEISADKQGENVVIAFTNKGNAIPPQKLDTIFEKFYRLDISRSSETGGSGLGLAIAKEIVIAHKGSISVKSDENKTVFTIIIPFIRKS